VFQENVRCGLGDTGHASIPFATQSDAGATFAHSLNGINVLMIGRVVYSDDTHASAQENQRPAEQKCKQSEF